MECQSGKAAVCKSGAWALTDCFAPTPACVAGVCKECLNGDVGCDGDTPKHCVNNAWQPDAACPSSKVCSAGACVSTRLSGGISVGAVPGGPTYKLREGGLHGIPAMCGATYCVKGGFR